MAEEVERIYVIPLKKYGYNSSKAAPTAVKRVKTYLSKHMKVEEKDIWMDDSLNNSLWEMGKYKIPSKIRVKAVKFDDGVVETYVPELEFKKSRRELLKEEKAKKEPILKREEAEPEEGEGETPGAEDYDITPTADGDVKIKKKKPQKDKKKKEEKPSKKEKSEKSKRASKKKEKKPTKKKTETKKKSTKTKSTGKKSSSKKKKSE